MGKCLACLEFMCKYSFGLDSPVERIVILERLCSPCAEDLSFPLYLPLPLSTSTWHRPAVQGKYFKIPLLPFIFLKKVVFFEILIFSTTSSKKEAQPPPPPTTTITLRVGFLLPSMQQRVCSLGAGMCRAVGSSSLFGPRLQDH